MNQDTRVSLLAEIVSEIIYVVITIIFLHRLAILNQKLRASVNVSDPFAVVRYQGYASALFVIGAAALGMFGIGLAIWSVKIVINQIGLGRLVPRLIGATVTTVIVNLWLIIRIIGAINDPILQAVMVVLMVAVALLSSIKGG